MLIVVVKCLYFSLIIVFQAALVYEAEAIIKYGDDLSYAVVTKFEGIG